MAVTGRRASCSSVSMSMTSATSFAKRRGGRGRRRSGRSSGSNLLDTKRKAGVDDPRPVRSQMSLQIPVCCLPYRVRRRQALHVVTQVARAIGYEVRRVVLELDIREAVIPEQIEDALVARR